MERNSRGGKRGKELYYLLIHKAEKKEEAKQRKLRAILNKLTPQNFDRVNIDNAIPLTNLRDANFCSHRMALGRILHQVQLDMII